MSDICKDLGSSVENISSTSNVMDLVMGVKHSIPHFYVTETL